MNYRPKGIFLFYNGAAARVFWLSGLIGFVAGALIHPSWQHAIEGAQAVAGVVRYPPETPFGVYLTGAWTLLHQIPALALQMGFSEITLSILMSGFLAMMVYQALAMGVFVFTKDLYLSAFAPLLIHRSGMFLYGVVYPIGLMFPSSYGVAGLGGSYLALMLLACAEWRVAGILLGLLPAIHPALGILTWLMLAVYRGTMWRPDEIPWRNLGKYFLIGLCGSVLSGAIQFAVIAPIWKTGFSHSAEQILIFYSFVRFWDGHRRPVPWNHPGIYLTLSVLGVSFLWLRYFVRDLDSGMRFKLKMLLTSCFFCLLFSGLTWLSPECLPMPVLSLMPARILNVPIFGCLGLLFGILSIGRRNVVAQTLFFLTVSGVTLIWARQWESWGFVIGLFLMTALFRMAGWIKRESFQNFFWSSFLRGVAFSIFAIFAVRTAFLALQEKPIRGNSYWADQSNDPFLAKVAREKGVLLISHDLTNMQMVTRRPVLLDIVQLDGLPYVPRMGPAANRILTKIYGGDLLGPLRDPPVSELFDPEKTRSLWEGRTSAEWESLSGEFGFSQVLTSPDYNLRLPVLAQSSKFYLYGVLKASKMETVP